MAVKIKIRKGDTVRVIAGSHKGAEGEVLRISKEDIQDKLTEYQKQLAELKMTHAISPLENPLQIQTARRVIARLKTALSNQEV